MKDAHFKYQIGELITHIGFLKPVRQPVIQRFQIVSRTLVEGPGCIHRFYYVCPAKEKSHLPPISQGALRVHEDHLAPLPADDR